MGTKDQDIRARVTADVAGYKRGMAEAGRATDDFARDARRAADEASSSWQRMAETAAGVAAGLGLAKGLQVVTDLTIGLAKESALLNARYETLGVVMESVGRNVGYNRAQMAGYADEVRKMGITLIESRNTVVNMAQAQMDLSRASELARIAQDAAVIGNINSSEALQRLTYGVKTAQVEVLRNIGINVSFEQSYSKLAAQLGKNVDALSEAEKTQARMNAVIEAGTAIAGTYEDAMGTAGKKMGSLDRYIQNVKTIFGETFNEALISSVDAVTGGLKDLTDEAERLQQEGDLREWGRATTGVFTSVLNAADNTYGFLAQAWRGAVTLGKLSIASSTEAKEIWRSFGADSDQWVASINRVNRTAEESQRAFDEQRATKRAMGQIFEDFNNKTITYAGTVERLISLQYGGAISAESMHRALRELRGETARTHEGLNDVGDGVGRVKDEFADLMGRLSSKDAGLDAGYAKDLQTLHAAYTSGKVGVDEYRVAVEQLIAQQPFARDQAKQQVEALREQAEAQEQYAEAWSRHLGGLDEQRAALEEQVELYGLTEAQIAAVNTQRAAERLEIAKRNGVDDAYIAALEKELELRQKIQAAAGTLEGRQAAADAARDAEQEWQRTAESIEQDLTDALMRGFESGQGFAENFRDVLINMFKTLVLRPIIQPVAQGMAGAVTNLISPGSSGGVNVGGFNNAISFANTGSPNGMFGGMFGVPAGGSVSAGVMGVPGGLPASTAGTGMYSAGVGASLGPMLSAFALGQQYGPIGGMLGAVGTTALGGALGMGAGAAAGGGLAGAGAALSAVPVWGWIAAAALAIIGGMEPNKPTNYWQGAEIDTKTGTVKKTGSYDPSSRRYSPENRAVADQMGAYLGSLSQTLSRITGEEMDHKIRIGVGSKDKHFTLDGVKTELKGGTNEELIDMAAGKLVDLVYDKLSDAAKGVVDALREEGESIEGALVWVVDGLPELNKWLDRFGVSVLDINIEGVRAAEALAQLAGGVGNLAALQGGYYDAFYTDAEKVLHMNADLSDALGDLGLGMVNSRDGFRQLVEAQDLNTEAGREAYVGLMALSPTMDQYLTMLEEQLDTTGEAAEASREYRAALEAQMRATEEHVSQLLRLSQMLHGALDGMRIGTLADDRMRRDAAIAQLEAAYAIARASGGRTLPDPDVLAPALNRAMEPSAHLYGSFVDYARDFYGTANTINGLAELTDDQLSIEEQTLRQLKDRAEIEDEYQKKNAELFEISNGIAADQSEVLKQIRALLDEQGLYSDDTDPTKPIPGMNGVYEPLGPEAQAKAQAALRDLVGDGPITDDVKRQIYAMAVEHGASIGITNATRLDEALGLPVGTSEKEIRRLGLPFFADGGYHSGGLRVVGERGWEIEATGPARYWSHEDSRRMLMGGGGDYATTAEIRQLRAEMRAMLTSIVDSTHRSAKTLEQIEFDGLEVRMES